MSVPGERTGCREGGRVRCTLVSRRGVALLAVLLVVVVGALVGTIALDSSESVSVSARLSVNRRQARAVAWSGVLGVMSELTAQRDELLRGGEPELEQSWELFEDGRLVGRVTLEPLWGDADGLGESGGLGPIVESESAKLNLNTANAETLARFVGLGSERAGEIVSLRSGSGLSSVEDLAPIGIDPDDASGELGGVSLVRLATATSGEPDECVGVGDSTRTGEARVVMGGGGEIDRRALSGVGREAMEVIERLRASTPEAIQGVGDAAAWMARSGVPPQNWSEALDVVGSGGGSWREGLVDINRAPEEVLASLPGIGAHARAIAEARERLQPEARRGIAWPLEAGLVSAREMADAVPWLTTRSLQWRVRVAGELVRIDEASLGERVIDRVVFDVVLDLAGERARVSYLRDSTYLRAAEGIRAVLLSEGLGGVAIGQDSGDDEPPEDVGTAAPFVRPAVAAARAESAPPAEVIRAPSRESGQRRGRWSAGAGR